MNVGKALRASLTPAYWSALARGVVPTIEHVLPLRSITPSTVLDVGANKGQFSAMAHHVWPEASIIGFEPIPEQAEKYKSHMQDATTLYECALAAKKSEMDLHIASRPDSSSLLPLDDRQKKLFDMDEVGTITVSVHRLDEILAPSVIKAPALLKIDVQGFEYEVLQGATGLIDQIDWIYVEASFAELYTGQKLFPEIKKLLNDSGFEELGRYNLAFDGDGEAIQADMLFARP